MSNIDVWHSTNNDEAHKTQVIILPGRWSPQIISKAESFLWTINFQLIVLGASHVSLTPLAYKFFQDCFTNADVRSSVITFEPQECLPKPKKKKKIQDKIFDITKKLLFFCSVQFTSVTKSCPWLFVAQWTVAHQASLSITNSRNLFNLMSIESVMPSNHLILYHPLCLLPSLFPAWGSFQMSQFFASGGQITGDSASTSVLPMSIQDWFPLGWTGWISWQSKGLLRVFSTITVWKHQFFSAQLSL